MSIGKKALAEYIGTFWLVLGGCGTAVLAGDHVVACHPVLLPRVRLSSEPG